MSERHQHHHINPFIGDLVFGAHDGVITTFAVIAGATSISLSPVVIIILAIANLLADGISMASSSYLSHQSERQTLLKQRFIEEWEVKHEPKEEVEEVQEILKKRGYEGEDLESLTKLITKKRDFWVDFMMREEPGIPKFEVEAQPLKNAIATFMAFVLAGLIPVLPYMPLFGADSANILPLSALFAAGALFLAGSSRSIVTGMKWFRAGVEMVLVGAFAGTLAYSIGFAARQIFNI